MLDIVIATRNQHKFHELKQLLKMSGIRWHSLAQFSHVPSVEENGRTFDANAVKKARAVARATGYITIADDSGVEVEALGGLPGVRSARFAGIHGDDDANNAQLLRLLEGLPPRQRRARYVCSLSLASPAHPVALTHGTWSGQIATRSRGHRGFGYDPIFVISRLGQTVAQLPTSTKQRLSHRARAARKLRQVLKRLVRQSTVVGRVRRGVAAAHPAKIR